MAKDFGALAIEANQSINGAAPLGNIVALRKYQGLSTTDEAFSVKLWNKLADPAEDYGVLSVNILRIFDETDVEPPTLIPVVLNNAVVRPNAGANAAGYALPDYWNLRYSPGAGLVDRNSGFLYMLSDGSILHFQDIGAGVEITAWIINSAFRDRNGSPLMAKQYPRLGYGNLHEAFVGYAGKAKAGAKSKKGSNATRSRKGKNGNDAIADLVNAGNGATRVGEIPVTL